MKLSSSLLIAVSLLALSLGAERARGQIFVANWNANRIYQIDSSGHYSFFAQTVPSQPQYLAFDHQGNLYASIVVGNTIQKFDAHGNAATFANTGLSQPESLAFDSSGNLYVANMALNDILKYDPQGHVSMFSSFGNVNAAVGLAFAPNGTLYGAFGGANEILKFDANGNQSVFAHAPAGCYYLTFAPNGTMYSADVYGDLYKVDAQGNFSLFAGAGSGSMCGGIAADAAGYIYMVRGSAIMKYDFQGNASVFATGPDSFQAGIAILTPEPSTVGLLALGLGAWAGRRRLFAAKA